MNEGLEKYEVTYKSGDIIFCEYEPGNELYIIKEGKVRITKIQDNKEKTLDIIGPGEIFGEMALIDNEKRTATTIAETDVVLIRIDRNNFELLAKTNHQWALKLLKILSKRIYDAKRKLRILSVKEPDLRVLETIIMLGEPLMKENQNSVTIQATTETIAHWCGLTTKNCEEIIYRYAKMGKLSIEKDQIIVPNINDIKRLVQAKSRST